MLRVKVIARRRGKSRRRILSRAAFDIAEYRGREVAVFFARVHVFGGGDGVQAQLHDASQLVAADPFFDDLVALAETIGDRQVLNPFSRRRSILRPAAVRAFMHQPMRRIQPGDIVAAPDDFVAIKPAIGVRRQRFEGRREDRLASIDRAVGCVQVNRVGVIVVELADASFFPDLVRDAEDVIDEVGVARVEAAHGLPVLALGFPHELDVLQSRQRDARFFIGAILLVHRAWHDALVIHHRVTYTVSCFVADANKLAYPRLSCKGAPASAGE